MVCEMCGSQDDKYITLVEGTELNVCDGCVKYGKLLKEIKREEPRKEKKRKTAFQKPEEPETAQIIVED